MQDCLSRRNTLLSLSDQFIDRRILERHCKVHYETTPEEAKLGHLRVAIAAVFFDVYRLDKAFLQKNEVKFITSLNTALGWRTLPSLFPCKYLQDEARKLPSVRTHRSAQSTLPEPGGFSGGYHG